MNVNIQKYYYYIGSLNNFHLYKGQLQSVLLFIFGYDNTNITNSVLYSIAFHCIPLHHSLFSLLVHCTHNTTHERKLMMSFKHRRWRAAL
jgi:hypothetical protein